MKSRKSLYFLVLSAAISMGCGINSTPGSGEKVGQIVKLSKQGIISQTWEGQLIRGGMSNGSGTVGTQPFNFTIQDDITAKKVREFMENQTEVVISYNMEGVYSAFRSDSSGHFLTSIEPAKK
jgi:hypothetical protein